VKFDANLRPFTFDVDLAKHHPTDGDVLDVTFDPTHTFSTVNAAAGQVAFDVAHAPPELQFIDVVSNAGLVSMQIPSPAVYAAGQDLAAAPLATAACTLLPKDQFKLLTADAALNLTVYRCPLPAKATLKEAAALTMLASVAKQGDPSKAVCLAYFPATAFTLLPPLDAAVSVDLVLDGVGLPSVQMARQEDGTYKASIPLKTGQYSLQMGVSRGGTKLLAVPSLSLRVDSKDTHSLVRVQAELMASDRARKLDFAVAVAPVNREFFKAGPWSWKKCNLFCTFTPVLVARLSSTTNSTTSTLALGGGLALFINRAFQFNGGLLVGTNDLNSGWRLDRSWFVGAGLDPFIIAEMLTVEAAPPAIIIDGDQQAETVTDGLNACGCTATLGGSTHGLPLMHSIHPSLVQAIRSAPPKAKAKKPRR
jgi:hypothetical protein